MNKKSIEKSIERAINEAPSLDFTKIANTPIVKMTEHDYITRQSETHVPNYHRQFAPVLACCVVMLLCFTGWFVQYRLPDSIITFDVNPSIAIVTNKQNQILSIKALNNDAQKVLDDININSSDLDSMAASIITSIINQGYLSTNKNVVMISVENKHLKKADTLALSLKQVIRNHALSQNINPQILKQTFKKNKDAAALAEQYNVSEGKLRLIKKIISSNNKYSIDTLASKSMEDLLDISEKNNIDLHEIIQFEDSIDKNINDNSSTSDEGQITKKANNTGNTDNTNNTNNTNNASQLENSPTKNSTQPSLNYNNENQSSRSGIVKNENRSSKSSYVTNEDSSSQSDNEQDEESSYQSDEDTNQHNISKSDNDSDSESKTNDSNIISEDEESNEESNDESNDDDSLFDTENNDTNSTSYNDDNEEHNVVETNDDNSDSESSSDSGEDDMDSSKQSSDEHDDPDYD